MLGPSSNTGMPILSRLVNLYETRGIQISTGLNPCHFDNYPLAPFTWFIQDGGSLTNGLGIALQEVYFLECLFARLRPERLFVVGNSLGWSTFALALLNPSARVLAIDAGFDRFSLDGLDFTNRVAAEEGLAITAVKAVSPGDVAPTLQAMRWPRSISRSSTASTRWSRFSSTSTPFGRMRRPAAFMCPRRRGREVARRHRANRRKIFAELGIAARHDFRCRDHV